MIAKLFFLFIVVPLVELILLLELAKWTSTEFTILLVLVTGTVGIWLARSQGYRTWSRIRTEMGQGQIPAESLLDGVLILLAGALLLTPGMLTDAFGLSLLLPPCRRFYRGLLVRWFKGRVVFHQANAPQEPAGGRTEVIDSYVVKREEQETKYNPVDNSEKDH